MSQIFIYYSYAIYKYKISTTYTYNAGRNFYLTLAKCTNRTKIITRTTKTARHFSFDRKKYPKESSSKITRILNQLDRCGTRQSLVLESRYVTK